jgi:NlpC/P60 family
MAAHTGSQFAALAARFIGTPYVYGGSSPSGFDCSGLIYYVLGKLGIQAPRTSQAQYAWTRRISPQALKPGDLVFLNFPGETGAGHVMIWLGNDKVLQAPSTGQKVQVSHFDPAAPGSNEWGATVVGYGRIPGLSYKGEASTVSAGGGTGSTSSGGGGIVSHIPVVGGVVSGAEATASFFDKLLDPHFWLRAVEVVGGFLILMLGLYLLTRQIGLTGVPEPPTPGLSEQTLADLKEPPGISAHKPVRSREGVGRGKVTRHEVGEAAGRRAAMKQRAARAQPTDDIPF